MPKNADLGRIARQFEKNGHEAMKFQAIKKPLHPRPDLCALLYLDKMMPGTEDIIGSCTSNGDAILNVDMAAFANKATKKDIIYLIRCGVVYSEVVELLFLSYGIA